MTNELAIRILTGDVLGTTEQTQEAITMAVRALSQPDVPDTNVGDMIFRQDAIDVTWEKMTYNEPWNVLTEVRKRLKALPSAQPDLSTYSDKLWRAAYERGKAEAEPRWIPMTERMPEEADGTVLVCMPDESPYNEREPFINAKHNQRVEVATYSQHSDTWYFAMGAVSSTRPIAWMPLPKPYERSEE